MVFKVTGRGGINIAFLAHSIYELATYSNYPYPDLHSQVPTQAEYPSRLADLFSRARDFFEPTVEFVVAF